MSSLEYPSGERARTTDADDPENPGGTTKYIDAPQRHALSWVNLGSMGIQSAMWLGQNLRASRSQDSAWSWLVCASACFVEGIVVGIHHIYGIFFATFLDEFHESRLKTALCGSFSYGLGMLVSPVVSLLVVRYGCRPIAIFGSLFSSVALFSASFVDNLDLIFITYGILFGIGSTFAFTTSQLIIGRYFDKHRSLAAGIVAAAPCVATLVLAPFTQLVISDHGWQTTFRLLCVLVLLTVIGEITYSPVGFPARNTQSHLSTADEIDDDAVNDLNLTSDPPTWKYHLELIKDPVFVVWVMAIAFYLLGAFIPFIHIIRLAEDRGYTANDGTILLTLLSVSTATGRLIFGRISDLLTHHRRHMQQTCMACIGIVTMLVPLSHTYGSMVAFCLVRGLFDGCVIVMMPVITMDIVGREKMTAAWGLMFGIASVFFTLGPSMSGWIYDVTRTYDVVFYIGGLPAITASLLLGLIPCAVRRSTRRSSVLKMVPIPIVASEIDAMYRSYDQCTAEDTSPTLSQRSTRSATNQRVLFQIGSTTPVMSPSRRIRGNNSDAPPVTWDLELFQEISPPQGDVMTAETASFPGTDLSVRKKTKASRVRRESECQSEVGCPETPLKMANGAEPGPTTSTSSSESNTSSLNEIFDDQFTGQEQGNNQCDNPSAESLKSNPISRDDCYSLHTPNPSSSASDTAINPVLIKDGNGRGDTKRPPDHHHHHHPTNDFFQQLNVRLVALSSTLTQEDTKSGQIEPLTKTTTHEKLDNPL